MLTLAVAVVSLFMVSCSGEDGEDGADGMTGAPGSSSVVSNTYTIPASDWSGGNATVTVPGLSKSIADNGQVSVFWTLDSLTTDTITWNPLPYRFVGNVGGQNQFITIQNTVSIGEITLSARLNTNAGVNFGSESYLRVVMIPSASRMKGVDHNNYEEVLDVYGIKNDEL